MTTSADRASPASPTGVALALAALYIVWGSTYLAMRIAIETIPPLLMAGPRFIVAGSAMYAFLRWRGAAAPSRAEWIASAKVGILLLTIGNGAVAFAETSVSSGVAAVVVGSMPLWAAVFGRFFGQTSGRLEWLGLALGFAGVVILNLGGDIHLDRGGLVCLLAPISWAFGSVWARHLPLPKGAMATATQMIVGGSVMLVLAFVFGERLDAVPSFRSLGATAYLAIFGSIIAFSAYTWLLRNVRPAVATSYAYVNPLVAVLLGRFVGSEPLGASVLAATVVSIAGVALIGLKARSESRT